MERRSYEELDQLKGYYFEDSYVLGVKESEGRLEFILDVVLTPQHKDYVPPPKGTQHCYKSAQLIFDSVTYCHWIEKSFQKFVDADGEVDFGNIDTFFFTEPDQYELTGCWGCVGLKAENMKVIE